MPTPSLGDFPDLCLLAVFKYLSILELFRTIRLVSTRWSGLLPTELNRRRSLVIVGNLTFDLSQLQLDQHRSHLIEHVKRDDGMTPWARLPHIDHRNVINRNNRYEDDALRNNGYSQLNNQVPPEMITTLVENLHQINNLTVVQGFYDTSALGQIVRMVDHWRENLVSMTLYLHHDCEICVYPFRVDRKNFHRNQMRARTLTLFDALNRVSSLKHLKLKMGNFRISPISTPMSILSQLSTFHSENDMESFLDDELVPYVSGNLDLQFSTKLFYKLKQLLGFDQEFCDRFIAVKIHQASNLTIEDMNRFCTRFSSLVHLWVMNHHIPMTRFARCLSHLTQLVHLSIDVYAKPAETNRPQHEQELPPDQIVPVPSVRLLTMKLTTLGSHNSTKQLQLPKVFPNVQVLSLENVSFSCNICKLDSARGNCFQIAPQLRQCALQARRPFRRFPRLHTIEVDVNDYYTNWLTRGHSFNDPKKLITIDEL